MALKLGFARKREEVESIWIDDPALKDVPDHVREAWEKDGAAAHLRPYATAGTPTVFKYRALSPREARHVLQWAGNWNLLFFEMVRLAVRFPGLKEALQESTGEKHSVMEMDKDNFPVLDEWFAGRFDEMYPSHGAKLGFVDRVGKWIYAITFPSEPEKKASSPPSTGTPSGGGDGTKASTEGTSQEPPPAV